ncbi:DNA primase [Putridiphycobacter roseus]|uniref:DNA primase n=1 Tax=Putridiphycobacter roseus TaxID=2219161 RepID=A0A2W1N0G3_9FLAO|nr:DNA primase [Putridiphycobacter roseus]PZE16990.1 DNA primase [Putridiphycobacter roseus]
MIPKETIDEIFQTARVEEVIGDFVQMKKAGSSFKAKSPFTDEKTASFMISPAKQIWKCFSTGKGGNVVSFLMEHEHFSYVEALKWLANKYGIEIKEDRKRTPEEIQATTIRENLSIVNEFAAKHFEDNLFENESGKAIGLSYFVKRGFREDIIRKFNLGYCIETSNAFTETALKKGYKLEFLEKAGLTKTKEGRSFDFFRGRVMFPIHSVAGKILGFGGRTLKADKKIAKYFNSPESELYNKSKILYGLYFAKNNIIKYDNCYLVEGYTDVISMHQAGVQNVVSSSGTSLTSGQINLIKRYSDNITILYDGDAAGIKASFRGIDMILEHGMNVRVVLFPDGEDPDSFAKKSSTEELSTYITDNAKDFIVFKSDLLSKEAAGDPLKKAQLIRDIVSSIALIPDRIKQQVYTKECANIFDIEEDILVDELVKLVRDKEQKAAKRRQFSQPSSFGGNEEPPPEALIPPEYQTDAPPVITTPQKVKYDNLYYQERDLIRLLLNYGPFSVKTKQIQENDKGEQEEIFVEVSVVQLILHELEVDGMVLIHPDFVEIFKAYKTAFEEGKILEEKNFTRNEDVAIANVAVDILSEKNELSPQWVTQKVKIKREVDNLDRAVIEAIYSYKSCKVMDEINTLQHDMGQIGSEDLDGFHALMTRQMKLEKVKLVLSAKLGRRII